MRPWPRRRFIDDEVGDSRRDRSGRGSTPAPAARAGSSAGGRRTGPFNPADGSPSPRCAWRPRTTTSVSPREAQETFLPLAPAAGAQARRDRAPDRRGTAAEQGRAGALVSLEMGKILAEGRGEVQEMIDIADFAVGLSRQLYGLTMHSERPGHRMYEQWHPLGVVGVISAFNFPVAVWSWNAMIAAVCGDCVLWKPSSETPLTAIAVQNICNRVAGAPRLAGRLHAGHRRGPHGRRADAARPPRAADSAPPAVARWATASPKSSAGAWAALSSNWAATTASSSPTRQPRPGAARHPVRRGRHRRPALHHHPPASSCRRRIAAGVHRRADAPPTRRSASATRWTNAPSWGRWSTAPPSTT